MKKVLLLPLLSLFALCGVSCYSEYPTVHAKRGTVLGGLLGAGAGAVIGNQSDRPLEGAAIGGAVGALTGGLLGSARDEAYYGRPYPAPAPVHSGTSYRPVPVPLAVPVPVPVYRSYGWRNYGYGYHRPYNRYYAPRRSYSYCR